MFGGCSNHFLLPRTENDVGGRDTHVFEVHFKVAAVDGVWGGGEKKHDKFSLAKIPQCTSLETPCKVI